MIYRRFFVAVITYSLLVLPMGTRVARVQAQDFPSFPAVSSTLVISQFEAGVSASNLNEEFVEIHNVSGSTVDLNGYRVVYRSSTASSDSGTLATWTTTTPLAAGAYYLIGSDVYGTNHPGSANITYSTSGLSTSGSNGGLAIRLGAANTGTVIDALGWGASATNALFEGTRAGAPGNTGSSLARLGNGCQDTDNNASDFSLLTPAAPRNTSSAPFSCGAPLPSNPTGAGAANPNNPNPNTTILFTVNVTPGANPTSTGIAVVADLSSIGGSATQGFFDDGTNGDVTPGDNVFSFATNAGTSGGIKTVNFTVADAQDRQSNGSFQFTVQAPSNPSGTGSANPNTVFPGGSTTLTFAVTPGTPAPSSGFTVTANLSSIGGSSSQAFTDSGDAVTFTFPTSVVAGTSPGLKNLPITITDTQGKTGAGNIQLTVASNSDPAPHTPGEHEVMGNPTAAGSSDPNDWLIERNQYIVSYNCGKGIPNWVEWHLDTSWLGSASRTDNYRAQTDIPLPQNCYQVQGSDYSGNTSNGGFDRGHDCPSGDRTNDAVPDNDATFIMTNFIPQAPNNNQQTWGNMENYIRSLATSGNEVYTWMGNAGQGGVGLNGFATTVANGRVVVPAYVWRVVMVLPVGASDLSRVDTNTRVFAVLTPNVQGLNQNWQTWICPVSKIEQLTGMTFFPNVPPATAAVLKQKVDPLLAAQTVASGSVTNLTLTYPETYMTGNVTVTGTLALGPETLNTTNAAGNTNYTVTLAPGATVTRMNSGMVTGNLEKQFSSVPAQPVPFEVGTLNGYSPVTASLTALGTNPSSLAVKAVQAPQPNANPQSTALKRYWTLTETGDLTANLTFSYLDADIPSGTAESSLKLNKYEGFFTQWPATQDTTANTVTTTTPVSQFSDWTLLPPLGTTAAAITMSGRVLDRSGAGVRNARVILEDPSGNTRSVLTNAFGYYAFQDLDSGSTFVATVSARGIVYQQRLVQAFDTLANIDFSPQ
ncbi:MAG: DNA/RNA non-specific endonuclease [Pyrinomonadaceae bacterium]